jgi:hypothetical protein
MQGTPKYGTMAEIMALMIWKKRQAQLLAKVRAQAQASLGGDKALDAYAEFRDLINHVDVKERTDKQRERLENLKKIKEIRFRPLVPPTKKSLNVRSVSKEALQESLGFSLKPITDFRPKRQK